MFIVFLYKAPESMLPTDLQDIVWAFCGDLRDLRHRLHKFVGLEIRIWGIVRGCPVRPSYLRARNNVRGPIVKLKHALELAYLQAEQKAFLERCRHAAAR